MEPGEASFAGLGFIPVNERADESVRRANGWAAKKERRKMIAVLHRI